MKSKKQRNKTEQSDIRSIVGEKSINPSYKYCPYLCSASLGSSASLKSSWKPRDWRDLKKIECEDLMAKSSKRTKMRRSVGLSGENDFPRNGRNEIRAKKVRSFDIGTWKLTNARVLGNVVKLVGIV